MKIRQHIRRQCSASLLLDESTTNGKKERIWCTRVRKRARERWVGGGLLNLTIVDVVWFLGWLGVVRSLT